jgi:adenylate cyclase
MNPDVPARAEAVDERQTFARGAVAPEFSLRRLAALILYGALVGAAYALSRYTDFPHIMRSALTGAVIAAGVTLFELLLLQAERGKRLQAGPFGAFLATRIGAWTLIILAGLLVGRILVPLGDGVGYSDPQMLLLDMGFSLAVSFIGITALSVQRLLGADVIVALLSGRYYRPQTETRVFLLLDMVGSTALADRFGDKVYLGVLNRALQEITPLIARSGGDIHRYVGDAVIVTWRPRLELRHAATEAVACAVACVEQIRRDAPRFTAEFGIAPGLRAAVHLGPVLAAEIGTMKREIAFLGDTMNTLARIEQAARESKRAVVLSGNVLAAATLPPGVAAEPLGDFTPRGKQAAIPLHALTWRGGRSGFEDSTL